MGNAPDEAGRQTGAETEEQALWSRRKFLLGSGGFLVASGVTLFAGQSITNLARSVIGSPVDTGVINLYQQDFYFVPNYMTWRVGDKLTVRLQNMSTTRWHEWQIGRKVTEQNTIFGTINANGFTLDTDFWNGVHVVLSNPYKIDNLVIHDAIPTFIGPKSEFALATGGPFSPTLKPGGHIDITFTVPDKPGLWEYGCFVQYATHWRLGMRGILNVVRA